MKKIKQLRYAFENSDFNYPKSISEAGGRTRPVNIDDYVDGSIFKRVFGENYSIYSLGIQSLPGTKFWINTNTPTEQDALILGLTGLYEIELNDEPLIKKLQFSKSSMEKIEASQNFILLIDIGYTTNE